MQNNIIDIAEFIDKKQFNNFDATATPSKRAKLSKDPSVIMAKASKFAAKSEPIKTAVADNTNVAPVVETKNEPTPTPEVNASVEMPQTNVATEFKSDEKIMASFENKGVEVIDVTAVQGDNVTRLKISPKVQARVSHADTVAKSKMVNSTPEVAAPVETATTPATSEPIAPEAETPIQPTIPEIPAAESPIAMAADTPLPTLPTEEAPATAESVETPENQSFDFNQKVDLGAMESVAEETPEEETIETEQTISPDERLDNYLTENAQLQTTSNEDETIGDFDFKGLFGEIESLKKNNDELISKIDAQQAENESLMPKFEEARERLENYKKKLMEDRLSLTQQYNLSGAQNRQMAEVIQMSDLIPEDEATKGRVA